MSTDSAPPSEATETREGYVWRKIGDHEKRIDAIESVIGAPANPITGALATGFVGAMDRLTVAMERLGAEVRSDKEERAREAAAAKARRDEEAAALAKRAEPRTWLFRLIVGTAIVLAMGSGFTALGAFLARHVH